MAINTHNERIALIEYGDVFQFALPVSADGIGSDDKLQMLWEYPGVPWADVGGSRRNLRLLGVGR